VIAQSLSAPQQNDPKPSTGRSPPVLPNTAEKPCRISSQSIHGIEPLHHRAEPQPPVAHPPSNPAASGQPRDAGALPDRGIEKRRMVP